VKIFTDACRTEVTSAWALGAERSSVLAIAPKQAANGGSGTPILGARLRDVAYPQTVSVRPLHMTDRTFAVVDGTSGSRTCRPPI
jgi:hypothetical protein